MRAPASTTAAAQATPEGVGALRDQQRDRVDTGCADALRVAQLRRPPVAASDPGASRPMRVMVARFRIIAVIGMRSSSASQTAASVRCSGGTASRGRSYSRTSSADSRADVARLGAGEALDQARQPVGVAAADDPLEQASVLGRDVQRRVAGGHRCGRVGQPQHVAVGDAVALAVLDRLVRQPVGRLGGVPRADRTAQRAAPAAPRPR